MFIYTFTQPCLTGFTSYSGAASCFPCPLGFSCSSSGATPCQSAGKYALNGVCLDCPIGYKCLGISPFLPIACTTGSYASTQGLAACTPCPAGSFCGDPTVSPVSCYAGSYSAANVGVCIPCPQGSICPMGMLHCHCLCNQCLFIDPLQNRPNKMSSPLELRRSGLFYFLGLQRLLIYLYVFFFFPFQNAFKIIYLLTV